MDKITQKKLAHNFLELHNNQKLLVLPNAWDVGSAIIFEKQGFSAIGTTSAGIAYSMGYPDGQVIKFKDLLDLTQKITNRISLPLSVDIERGYSNNIKQLVENVKRIIKKGAVGINIEDGYFEKTPYELENLDFQVKKIKALKKLKKEIDIPFVINARTCALWFKLDNALNISIKRCKAFIEAGADCVFIPGGLNENDIKTLTREIKAPINIVANPILSDLSKIERLGIKRLSIGSGAARTTFSTLIELSKSLKNNNSIDMMLSHDFSYDKANCFFQK